MKYLLVLIALVLVACNEQSAPQGRDSANAFKVWTDSTTPLDLSAWSLGYRWVVGSVENGSNCLTEMQVDGSLTQFTLKRVNLTAADPNCLGPQIGDEIYFYNGSTQLRVCLLLNQTACVIYNH